MLNCEWGAIMSCYFRHMKDVIKEAGVELKDKEDRIAVDKAIHSLLEVEYKDCSSTWKEIKKLKEDETFRKKLIEVIKNGRMGVSD